MQTARINCPELAPSEVQRIGRYTRQPKENLIDLDDFLRDRDASRVWLINDKVLPDASEARPLCRYLKISNTTLAEYRVLAYRHVPDYKASCDRRNPSFEKELERQMALQLMGKRVRAVQPDAPPFTALEAYILCAIAHLFKQFRRKNRRNRTELVIEFITKKNKEGFTRWYKALGMPIELPEELS